LFGEPIALKFGNVRQRLEVAHAVQINFSHQVVELVLDNTGGKTFGSKFEPISMAVQSVNAQFSPPGNASAQIRNAEASFPVFEELFIEHGYIRIDKDR